jgi:hypothetical protein
MNIFMRMTQDGWSGPTLRKLLAEGDETLNQKCRIITTIIYTFLTSEKMGPGYSILTVPWPRLSDWN